MKKKLSFPKFSLITFIIGVASLVFYAIAILLQMMGTLLYFSGINTDTLYFTILCAGCMLVTTSIAVFLFKNFKHKWISVLISAILTVIIVFLLIFIRTWYISDTDYFEVTSDDSKHDIVVREWAWLLAGGGNIYEKTSPFTMKEVGSYGTDDGYRPFKDNNYYFVWNENDFELHLKNQFSYFYCSNPMEYIK